MYTQKSAPHTEWSLMNLHKQSASIQPSPERVHPRPLVLPDTSTQPRITDAQFWLHTFICLFYYFDIIFKKIICTGFFSPLVCFHIGGAYKDKQLKGFLLYHKVLSLHSFLFQQTPEGWGLCPQCPQIVGAQ